MRKLVIYVDMDGVVAKWNKYATLEDTHTPGYFYEREPELGLMDCIKRLAKDFVIIFLTSTYEDSHSANDKARFLKKYGFGDYKVIYVPYGKKKLDYIDRGCPSFLIDDYTKNLKEWEDGQLCHGIKFLNGINNTHGTWKGRTISHTMTPEIMFNKVKTMIEETMGLGKTA